MDQTRGAGNWITVITEWSMWTHFEGLRTKLFLTTFYDFFTRHFRKRKKSRFWSLKKRKIRILEHCSPGGSIVPGSGVYDWLVVVVGSFSRLVHNYSTQLAPTRENCREILQRLQFTRYALGHSKASVLVAVLRLVYSGWSITYKNIASIVDTCLLTKFEGGLNLLHKACDDAVIWLESIYSDCSTRDININNNSNNWLWNFPRYSGFSWRIR